MLTTVRGMLTTSVIVPTYQREGVLVDTLRALVRMLQAGDEILVIDQTPRHEPDTERALAELSAQGKVRWYRKAKPSQCEAMNAAARLARCDLLLFLDDDIVPFPGLIEGHRSAFAREPDLSATTGQVLQPWNAAPIPGEMPDRGLGFDFASTRPADVLSLMAGNFAMRRETFLAVGGMDENFTGNNYRNDAEMAWRTWRRTGRKVRFVPEAGLRHLLSGGGNRAFGQKDTWGAIGGSIGDYYFALKHLPAGQAVTHILRRFVRAPLNRHTVRRPWLIVVIAVREVVAFVRAFGRVLLGRNNYIKDLAGYPDLQPIPHSRR